MLLLTQETYLKQNYGQAKKVWKDVVMEFFDVISRRRSVRTYTNEVVPPEVIQKAVDAALIAPNS